MSTTTTPRSPRSPRHTAAATNGKTGLWLTFVSASLLSCFLFISVSMHSFDDHQHHEPLVNIGTYKSPLSTQKNSAKEKHVLKSVTTTEENPIKPNGPPQVGNARNNIDNTITNMSKNSRSTTKTRTNNHDDGDKPFVTIQLKFDKPYNITYGQNTLCRVGVTTNKFGRKPIERVGLSQAFSEILNVTTYVQTNLKILSLGDSVGMQFHELLEEALQPETITANYRTVYYNAWGNHESVSVTAPVNGGGALAAFRMTGLFLEEGKGKPPPNKGPDEDTAVGGWLPQHVRHILKHKLEKGNTVGSFDVMIFRIPHGWLPSSSITRGRLEASLKLAMKVFGVKTVIIQTIFFNNNVKTMEDLTEMHETNQMIRELVKASWGDQNLPDLLLMDFGGWVDQLIELNARLSGMDTQPNDYTLARLGCLKFPPSIAVACAESNVTTGSCKCKRNIISIDGMHWCMETMGGRIIAGFACLMQCSLLILEGNDDKHRILGTCQQRCNDEFMSLNKASSLVIPG